MILDFIYNGWNILALVIILIYGVLILSLSKSSRQISAIPAFSTGIGVFFTFLVLWYELHDFKMPPTQESTAFLEELIRKLTSAFSTSIIGVLMSLVFTPFVKKKLDSLDLEKAQLKDKPHLQKDPRHFLHELVQQQQKQEKLINENNTAIGDLKDATSASMGEVRDSMNGLSSNFKRELTQIFEGLSGKINTEIKTISNEAIEKTQATTEGINDKFRGQTSELLKGNLGAIETALDTNNKHLSETITELKEFVSTIKGQFTEAQNNANEQIERVQGGIEKTSEEINTHLDGQATKLSETIGTINSTMLELNTKLQGATQKLLDDNLDKLTKAFTSIDELQKAAHTKLESSTSEFAKAVNQYQDFTDNNKAIIEAVKAQVKASENLTEKNEAIAQRWEQLSLDVETMQNRIEEINLVVLQLDGIKNGIERNGKALIK